MRKPNQTHVSAPKAQENDNTGREPCRRGFGNFPVEEKPKPATSPNEANEETK